MKTWSVNFLAVLWASCLLSCTKNDKVQPDPKLIILIDVDENQIRLGNNGSESAMPAGNAGQSPVFNSISAHYFELAQDRFTQLGQGEILYSAPETTKGGANAIDFDKSTVIKPGEQFLEIPLKNVTPGTYEWVRVSLSYQNYDVQFHYNGIGYNGTIASFVGYNTYISSYEIKNSSVSVNENKLQGYWGFESLAGVETGQAPAGATTVPNPLFASSPIPAGSCVVTGEFSTPLTITGDESKDITVVLSLSTNKSFEWKDTNGNGKWDLTEAGIEEVVDMGIRGLLPVVQ